MEEMETPTEQAQEDIHHHAHHTSEKWVTRVALSSALIAALAAVSVLLAGKHANEAMIEQSHGNNQWAWYQAKSIKAVTLRSKMDMQRWSPIRTLTEEEQKQFKEQQGKDKEKLEEYGGDQEKLQEEAKKAVEASKHHMEVHESFAHAVTLFQLGIAMAAISVVSKRSAFWFVALGFSVVGVVFMTLGFFK